MARTRGSRGRAEHESRKRGKDKVRVIVGQHPSSGEHVPWTVYSAKGEDEVVVA
jgi:hypothetical protein